MFFFLVQKLSVLFFYLKVGSFTEVIIVNCALWRRFTQLCSSEQVNLFWVFCEIFHHKRNLFDCFFASIFRVICLLNEFFHSSSISVDIGVLLWLCDYKGHRSHNFHFQVVWEHIKIEHVHKSSKCFKEFSFSWISKAVVLYQQNKLAFFHNFKGTLNHPWNSNHSIVFSPVQIPWHIN